MVESEEITSGVLPWTRSCLVCGESNTRGFRLKSRMEDGRVVLDYTTRETDLGWRHLVHGGIAMTLLDEVMTWAAIVALRRPCVAAEMTTRLRRPIRVGQALRVQGEVTARRSRLVTTGGVILDEGGRALVTAAGKYVPMPSADEGTYTEDFVAGQGAIDPGLLLRDHTPRRDP